MMGSSRANEKGKAPAYANRDTHRPSGVTLLERNVEDDFDSIIEPIGNPSVYSMNPNSLQNPQTNSSCNIANTDLQEAPLLSDWDMGWGQQYMNQGHNAISYGGESSFGSCNRPRVNRNVAGSSFLVSSRDTAPVHTRNNVNINANQSGVQGKFEGSFLSLGLGGTSVNSSQLDSREISGKLKEASSSELKIARSWKTTGQTCDDGSTGSRSNNNGFFIQSSHVSRMASTNNKFASHGSLNSGLGSSSHHILRMQQNDRKLGRADKLKEAASTELKMVHARKATHGTLDGDYEVGVHSKLSEQGSSRNHVLHMQQIDSRNSRSVDLDHYKGNQSVHSGTRGGNSAHFFNSQQHNLNPPEFVKPSRAASYYTRFEQLQHFRSTTANSPNHAGKQGQVTSQNDTPTQVLGGNLFSQTATPQVSWIGRGLAGNDAPFPKRLGVEFGSRNSPQSSQGHLSSMGRSSQTTNKDQRDVAPVNYPMNYQEPFFTYGQSQIAPIQLPKVPQGTLFTNASTVDSQSQKLNFHVRPHHKRTAVAPQSASHWVQRQKIIHPTVHHSMPKPPIPVRSWTRPADPVSAHVSPVIPYVKNVKPRAPVASAPALSHITWKDPEATSKLSGYKCLLCKRDLALTSEGPVFQPAVRPPVAVLSCGHTFHDQCLQNITPGDQAKDPPCIPCAIGDN